MKRHILYFILCLLTCLCFSCKNTVDTSGDVVVEGKKALMNLAIQQKELKLVAGLSPAQETAIHNVTILVFNKSGAKITQAYFDSNITSNLQNVATQSGSNMTIYIIANLSNTSINNATTLPNFFNTVSSLSDLNSVLLNDLPNDSQKNLQLIMQGSISATIQPLSSGITNNVTVQLHFIAAKVQVWALASPATSGDQANFGSWDLQNVPKFGYLVPQSTDAAATLPGTNYISTNAAYTYTDTTYNGQPAKYASFYIFENRKGSNTNTSQSQKAGNAPANATAFVTQGFYYSQSTSKVTGFKCVVPIGTNNFNDYNVVRGTVYDEVLTVTGVNSINVDTRFSGNNFGNQVLLYQPTLDCHPDWRPIQVTSYPGETITLGVYLDAACIQPAPQNYWLQLSTINLNAFTSSNTRPTYNPSTDMTNSLALNFTISPTSSQTVYLYAAENLSPTSRTAYIKASGSSTVPGEFPIKYTITQQGYQLLGNASSTGLRTVSATGDPTTDDYQILVEKIEEPTLNLTPGAAVGSEGTNTMAWGYSGIQTQSTTNNGWYYWHNGLTNTLLAVYGDATGGLSSSLLTPFYGRLGTTVAGTAFNPIFNANAPRYCFEKNRDLDGDGKITNPNTQGINEINWYLPSQAEMLMMYVNMPTLSTPLSANTYQTSTERYGVNNQIYNFQWQTAVQGNGPMTAKTNSNYVRCVRHYYPSPAPTPHNSPYLEAASSAGSTIINSSGFDASVLRTSPIGNPTPVHVETGAINSKVSPRFAVALNDCKIDGSPGPQPMYWNQACGWTAAANTSNGTGVVASPATGCNAYSEAGYPAGSWRVPTLKELMLIAILLPDLKTVPGFNTSAQTLYWSSTAKSDNASIAWTLAALFQWIGYYNPKANSLAPGYLRCVRDI